MQMLKINWSFIALWRQPAKARMKKQIHQISFLRFWELTLQCVCAFPLLKGVNQFNPHKIMSRCFLWLFFHTLHENRKLRDTHGNNKNTLLPPARPDTQLRRCWLTRLSRTFRGSSSSARHLDWISWSEIQQLSCFPSMCPSPRRTMCALLLSSSTSSSVLLLSCVLGCT